MCSTTKNEFILLFVSSKQVPQEVCHEVDVAASKVKRPKVKIWCGPAIGDQEEEPIKISK